MPVKPPPRSGSAHRSLGSPRVARAAEADALAMSRQSLNDLRQDLFHVERRSSPVALDAALPSPLEAIELVHRRVGQRLTLSHLVSNGQLAPDALDLLRNISVAHEQGESLRVAPEVWQEVPWPATDEAVGVLRRVAKAFGQPETLVRIVDGTLDGYRSRSQLLGSEPAQRMVAAVESRYPSLGAARALAAIPELQSSVATFNRHTSLHDVLPSDFFDLYLLSRPNIAPEAISDRARDRQVIDRRVLVMGRAEDYVTQAGPLTNVTGISSWSYAKGSEENIFKNAPTRFFTADANDTNLLEIADRWKSPSDIEALVDAVPVHQVLSFYARRVELRPDDDELVTNLAAEFQRLLDRGDGSREVVLSALRLAQAAHLDIDRLSVGGVTLREAAERLELQTYGELRPFDVAKTLRVFAPGSTADSESRVRALEALQATDASAPSFRDIVAGVHAQLGAEGFEPLSWADLSEPQRERVIIALTADRHMAPTSMLTPLFVEGAEEPLVRRLRDVTKDGYAYIEPLNPYKFSELSRETQQYLFEPEASTDTLMLRRSLVLDRDFVPESFRATKLLYNSPERLLQQHRSMDEGAAVRTMFEVATLKGDDMADAYREMLKRLVATQRIDASTVDLALLTVNEPVLEPSQLEPIGDAFTALLRREPSQELALVRFMNELSVLSTSLKVSPQGIVVELLARAHAEELQQTPLRLEVASQDRSQRLAARLSEVPPAAATLTSFELRPDVGLAPMSSADAAAILPRLAFELRHLKLRLERMLVMSFIKGGTIALPLDAEQQAVSIANRSAAELLRDSTPQARHRLYTAARTLIGDVVATLEELGASLDAQ